MKTGFPLVALALVLLMGLERQGAAVSIADVQPVGAVPILREAVVVDGRLEERVWQSAAAFALSRPALDAPPRLATEARAFATAEALYVGFVCPEPEMAKTHRGHTERDSSIWLDECVEVFVDTSFDRRTYHHFILNILGVQYDEFGRDSSWNADWESAVAEAQDAWSVELRIPWSSLGSEGPPAGLVGINFCRARHAVPEQTAWAPTFKDFHAPDRFGVVVIRDPAVDPAVELAGIEPEPEAKEPSLRWTPRRRVARAAGYLTSSAGVQEVSVERVSGRMIVRIPEQTGSQCAVTLVGYDRRERIVALGNAVVRLERRLRPNTFGQRHVAPRGIQLWSAPSTYKIFPDTPAPAGRASARPVRIEAAANEFEAFQLVVRPARTLGAARVSLSDLKSEAEDLVPAASATIHQVQYVNVEIPTDEFGHVGQWPDPLPVLRGQLETPRDGNTVLWVSLKVSAHAPAGVYRGTLTLDWRSGTRVAVPVELEVFGFALPDETHTETAYGVNLNPAHHGPLSAQQTRETWDLYMQLCRDHRISPYTPHWLDPIDWDIQAPATDIDTGPLVWRCDSGKGETFRALRNGEPLLRHIVCLAQFEREGIGYHGTGLGWSTTQRILSFEERERRADRLTFRVVAENASSGECRRRFECTLDCTFYADRPLATVRLVSLRNTDTVRYRVDRFFHLVTPVQELGAQAENRGDLAYWRLPDYSVVATSRAAGVFSYGLRRSDAGLHGDISRGPGVWLEPGETWEDPEAELVLGLGPSGEEAEVEAWIRGQAARLEEPSAGRIAVTSTAETGVRVDFARFDRAMERYLDGFHFNAFNLGGIPGDLGGHPRYSPEFNAIFRQIYSQVEAHLERRGWLEKAYWYWVDEPPPDKYEDVAQGMRLLKEACPRIRRLLTSCHDKAPIPYFYDLVNLWVPILHLYDWDRAHERQALGEQVWWYVCCGPRAPYPNNFIDHPAINHRIRFWWMERAGVDGSLYWSITYWAQNPWESAMAYDPNGGTWGNGDGRLLYPPRRTPPDEAVVEPPITSIRLELLREGLEDREYFHLLKAELARTAEIAAAEVQECRASARHALDEALDLIPDPTRYETDPARLYDARRGVARAIEALQRF